MNGGSGDDLLVSQKDGILIGGDGRDTFRIGVDVRFSGQLRAPNILLDYNPADDRIELILSSAHDETVPNPLVPGALPASQFTTERPTAFPGAETVFYDRETGELSIYDAQGNSVGLYLFARLPTYLDLTAANFTVVGP